jgi:pyridoxine 5'-phosphate synthase PdxJ
MATLVIAKDPVKVSLLIEAEDDEGKDFLEISLFITKQDESLTKALVEAEKLVKEIEKHVKNYCEQDSKNKKCGDAFEV